MVILISSLASATYSPPDSLNVTLVFNKATWVSGPSYCYQEFANKSTACGGLGTGEYSFDDVFNDGNWNTYQTFTNGSEKRINYTVPDGSLDTSLWQLETNSSFVGPGCWVGWNVTNYSLKSCFAVDKSLLQFRIYTTKAGGSFKNTFLHISCNGIEIENYAMYYAVSTDCAGWLNNFFEEAMIWEFSKEIVVDPLNVTLILDEGIAPPPTDSCSCTGINTDMNVLWRDNCTIGACDIGTGTLTVNGTNGGNLSVNGKFYSRKRILQAPTTGTFKVYNSTNLLIR